MALYVILGLAVVAFLVIRQMSSAPVNAVTLVRIRKGNVDFARGKVKPHTREMIREILAGEKIGEGYIAVSAGNHVTFSRHIPDGVQQRLRNVLLNQ